MQAMTPPISEPGRFSEAHTTQKHDSKLVKKFVLIGKPLVIAVQVAEFIFNNPVRSHGLLKSTYLRYLSLPALFIYNATLGVGGPFYSQLVVTLKALLIKTQPVAGLAVFLLGLCWWLCFFCVLRMWNSNDSIGSPKTCVFERQNGHIVYTHCSLPFCKQINTRSDCKKPLPSNHFSCECPMIVDMWTGYDYLGAQIYRFLASQCYNWSFTSSTQKNPPTKPQLSQARDASKTFITCDERLSTKLSMRRKVMRPSIIKFHHYHHFHRMWWKVWNLREKQEVE